MGGHIHIFKTNLLKYKIIQKFKTSIFAMDASISFNKWKVVRNLAGHGSFGTLRFSENSRKTKVQLPSLLIAKSPQDFSKET